MKTNEHPQPQKINDTFPLPEGDVIPSICEQCGEPFDAMVLFGTPFPFCDDCNSQRLKRWEEKQIEEKRKSAKIAFERICPLIYRETRTDHPEFPRRKDEQAQQWQPGPKGLVLFGPTRKGKSRVLWRLIQRLMTEDLLEVLTFRAGQLEGALFEAYRTRNLGDFQERFQSAPVVSIDDFGKEKFTDRFQAFIFQAFNDRFEARKPILLTTNFEGDDLHRRFEDQTQGEPFVARLREFCDAIYFK